MCLRVPRARIFFSLMYHLFSFNRFIIPSIHISCSYCDREDPLYPSRTSCYGFPSPLFFPLVLTLLEVWHHSRSFSCLFLISFPVFCVSLPHTPVVPLLVKKLVRKKKVHLILLMFGDFSCFVFYSISESLFPVSLLFPMNHPFLYMVCVSFLFPNSPNTLHVLTPA